MNALSHLESAGGARLSVWPDAPSLDGARTAAIGGFSCADAQSGALLLREAAVLLAAQDYRAIIGPMDSDTWSSHRLVVDSDGSAPFLMEPQNPAHYPWAFDQAGFAIVARYVSAELPILAPSEAWGEPAHPPAGISLRAFDRTRPEAELRALHALSLEAFAGNAFYKPITAEHFLASYRPVIDLFDPELTVLAQDKDGALVGFLFGIPNFAEGPAPRSIVLKTYASKLKGVGGALASEFHRRARERGFERVIHALMHEDNFSARHSEKLGARVFRRYALWGMKL